jgi:hypothetical protein
VITFWPPILNLVLSVVIYAYVLSFCKKNLDWTSIMEATIVLRILSISRKKIQQAR